MKYLAAVAFAAVLIGGAHAQTMGTCKAAAAEKKLAGAALKSFMTKCETDAKRAALCPPRKRSSPARPRKASPPSASATRSASKPGTGDCSLSYRTTGARLHGRNSRPAGALRAVHHLVSQRSNSAPTGGPYSQTVNSLHETIAERSACALV